MWIYVYVFLCKHVIDVYGHAHVLHILQRLAHERHIFNFKEYSPLHAAPFIGVSSKTMDQSEDPIGRASAASFF